MAREFQLTTLDNGFRVVSVPLRGSKIASIGTWVDAGSRYETKAQNGISHFLEHMFIKGTSHLSARQTWYAIESLGGALNAETDYETIKFYAQVLGADLGRGFKVIADILRNATFPQRGLDKERLVVLEEIKQDFDSTAVHVVECFWEKCFAGQAFGRPVMGSPEVINSLSRDDLIFYKEKHFTPERMVTIAVGAVNHSELVELAQASYGDMLPASRAIRPKPAIYTGGGDVRVERDTQQMEIYTGFQGVGELHPDWPAYQVLSRMLGGNRSSPLFQKIRTQHSLAYEVETNNWVSSDAGVFYANASLSADRVTEYLDVLTEVLLGCINKFTERGLYTAKKCINIDDEINLQEVNERAEWAVGYVLMEGSIPTAEERHAKINAVTLDDLHRVHAEIFSTKPTLAVIGDISHLESYEDFSARFPARRSRRSAVAKQSPR